MLSPEEIDGDVAGHATWQGSHSRSLSYRRSRGTVPALWDGRNATIARVAVCRTACVASAIDTPRQSDLTATTRGMLGRPLDLVCRQVTTRFDTYCGPYYRVDIYR